MKMIRFGLLAFLSMACLSADGLPDAVKIYDRAALRALLDRCTADVNAPMADGTTALHWAVRADDLETAGLLIRAGADSKVADRHGVTPLSLASPELATPAMVKALLDAGARLVDSSDGQGETALVTASRTGNVDAVKLLLDHGAQVNGWDTKAGSNRGIDVGGSQSITPMWRSCCSRAGRMRRLAPRWSPSISCRNRKPGGRRTRPESAEGRCAGRHDAFALRRSRRHSRHCGDAGFFGRGCERRGSESRPARWWSPF